MCIFRVALFVRVSPQIPGLHFTEKTRGRLLHFQVPATSTPLPLPPNPFLTRFPPQFPISTSPPAPSHQPSICSCQPEEPPLHPCKPPLHPCSPTQSSVQRWWWGGLRKARPRIGGSLPYSGFHFEMLIRQVKLELFMCQIHNVRHSNVTMISSDQR